MKRKIFIICHLSFVILALASCAEAEPENTDAIEQTIFDAWMVANVPDNGPDGPAVMQPNGMYVQFLADGPQGDDDLSGRDADVWLRLEYTDTDLAGNVFATRDSVEAMRQRSFTPHTYYVPEFTQYNKSSNIEMTDGRFYALGRDLVKEDGTTVKLTQGAHVRLYMPSYLAYGSYGYNNTQGYGGQYSLGAGKPVVEDLEVVEVIDAPREREETMVTAQAQGVWGCQFPRDTISTYFYVDTLSFDPDAAFPSLKLSEKFPAKEPYDKKYKLTVDSVATVWYIGKFLPSAEYPSGFIFDTNIESVYEAFYNRKVGSGYAATPRSSYNALSYKPSRDQSSYIQAFYKAIPNLRRGQWSRIVFSSKYGYGSAGSASGNTIIPSYTPLIFEFYIEPLEEEEEE